MIGVGINPLLSAMRQALDLKRQNKDAAHIPTKVQLVYSASAVNELVFQVGDFLAIRQLHLNKI